MFYVPFSFDNLCGAFVQTIRRTIDACVTAFNFLDPFRMVRAASRLQRSFLQVVA